MSVTAEVLPEHRAPRTVLGESPRWDGTAWWWVDAHAGTVWTAQPDHPGEVVLAGAAPAPLVQPTGSGGAVIATGLDLVVAGRTDTGGWHHDRWTTVEVPAGHRLNDGTADAAGRLWIGSVAPDRSPAGTLVRVDRDGSCETVADGFRLTNGMAWDADRGVLWHADTFASRVWTHRIDPDTGRLLGSEVAIDLGEEWPDGLCLDAAGGVWVAVYRAGEVRRYADGQVTDRVTVGAPQATSVALGGPDGRSMLITTAREGYDDERSVREPAAGRIHTARAARPGAAPALARPILA